MDTIESHPSRVRQLNPGVDAANSGLYVAYWMVGSRRTFWNPALERAAQWSRKLGQSLVVCEPIRRRPEGGRLRAHRFHLDGMVSNARRLAYAGVLYHPFVESKESPAAGLLPAVAKRSSVWITDDCLSSDLGEHSHLTEGASLAVRAEAVDGESIAPGLPGAGLAGPGATDHESFDSEQNRTLFRRALLERLRDFPARNPLAKFFENQMQSVLPSIRDHWPAAPGLLLSGDPATLQALELSPPPPFPRARGGSDAAFESWRSLIGELTGAHSDGTPRSSAGGSSAGGSAGRSAGGPVGEPAEGGEGGDSAGEPRSERAATGGADLHDALVQSGEDPDPWDLLAFHLAAGHISSYQILAECLRHTRWTPESLGDDPADPIPWWGLPEPVARLLETYVVGRDLDLAASRARFRGLSPEGA